jgi:hypothetical protein
VPLPSDIVMVQVAVRIMEMEEDGSGNIIGYKVGTSQWWSPRHPSHEHPRLLS